MARYHKTVLVLAETVAAQMLALHQINMEKVTVLTYPDGNDEARREAYAEAVKIANHGSG